MGWFVHSIVSVNRKMPISDFLRIQLTQPQSRQIYWHYHPEEHVAVLSDYSLERPEVDLYKYVDFTLVTDGGRYIRPPDDLPDDILDYYKTLAQREASELEELSEESGISVESLREYMRKRTKPEEFEEIEEEVSKRRPLSTTVLFYLSEELIEEVPNVSFLLPVDQFDVPPFRPYSSGLSVDAGRRFDEDEIGEDGQELIDVAHRLEQGFLDEYR